VLLVVDDEEEKEGGITRNTLYLEDKVVLQGGGGDMNRCYVVEDEPLMMLGSDPNTIKEDFSNDLDGQHSADKNLYKCSVETRTGSGSKKNMGSWNYSRGHSKATP
ncbi:hypothetical protein Tco_1169203, partial [Tanacetum coccineum]